MSVVIVLFGKQDKHVEQRAAQLAKQYPGITVLQAESGCEPASTLLPPMFRLAWLFVQEDDLGLPAVSQWCRHLSATAPVTIASHETRGDALAVPAGSTLPSGTFLQSYTADTAQQVFEVIAAFLSRAQESDDPAARSDGAPAERVT